MILKLYGTEGCHLCDEAEVLIRSVISPEIELKLIDIVDDDVLYERYQFTIPVLQIALTGAELKWPFTKDGVREFLTSIR